MTATVGANCLTNDGYLYGFGGVFSAIDADGSACDLLNGSQGLITAANPGSGVIDLDLTERANLLNHGTIHSPNDEAISFTATDAGAEIRVIQTRAGSSIVKFDVDRGRDTRRPDPVRQCSGTEG